MFTVGSDFDSMYKMFDLADEYKQSWQGWMYKPYGCVKEFLACYNETKPGHKHIVVQNLSRTYPQAVAGHTKSYSFDKDSRHFSLTYAVKLGCSNVRTEVYFNKKMHYSNGYDYKVTPKNKVKVQESEDGLKLFLDHSDELMPGTIINFNLVPI